jgi:U3 small nucleolar RNA-associated protein 22
VQEKHRIFCDYRMDAAPPKRRKLDHSSSSASSTSRAATFAMETEELLRTVRLDGQRFEGADELLRKIKGSIENIEGHEPLTVSHILRVSDLVTL